MSALFNQHAFGLHITDVAIKVAELAPFRGSFRLIAFGEQPLPTTAVIDGAINDPKLVAEEISHLINKPTIGQITTSYVVCSIPESRVFLKTIMLPKFPRKQLEEAILWEARSILPLPSEKSYYQEQILEENEKGTKALIAATEKHLVDGYLKVLQLADLTPIAFDLECYATARTVKEEQIKKRLVLQIHIGTKVTTFTVLRNGQVFFSHALNTGIASFGEELAKERNMTIQEADELFQKTGLDQLKGNQTLKEIASGITSTTKFYQEQNGDKDDQIEGIVFTGGFSTIPGMIDRIGKLIPNRPVIRVEPRLDVVNKHIRSPLLISIGLALRGAYPARWQHDLNFLPDSFISRLEIDEAKKNSFWFLSILGYIATALVIILGLSSWKLNKEILDTEKRYNQIRNIVDKHPSKELFSWVKQTNNQISFMEQLESQRFPFYPSLRRISTHIPEGVVLESLNFTGDSKRFKIKGLAPTRAHILAFQQSLKNDGAFHDIKIPLGSFNDETNIVFTMEFILDETKL